MATLDLLVPGTWAFWQNSPNQRVSLLFGVHSLILIRSDRTLLFDTGQYANRLALLDALRARGMTPDDVDAVIMSHLHWDHVLNLDLFRRPPIFVHQRELDYAVSSTRREGDWATPKILPALLDGKEVKTVSEGDVLAQGVTVMETPGHSPGQISLQVLTDDGPVCLASDAAQSARSLARLRPEMVFWDETEAVKSLRKVRDAAPVIYPGHDRPVRFEKGRMTYLMPVHFHLRCVGWSDPQDEYWVNISVPVEAGSLGR